MTNEAASSAESDVSESDVSESTTPEPVSPALVPSEPVEPEPEAVIAEPEPEAVIAEPEPEPEPAPEAVALAEPEPAPEAEALVAEPEPEALVAENEPTAAPKPVVGASAPAGTAPPPPPVVGASRPAVAVGRIVSVEVVASSPSEIEVKLADGRAGVISRADFGDEPMPSPGSTIEAALLARDDPQKRVVLSRSWAVKLQRWERVEAAKESGQPLTGPVTRSIKGGLIVDLGLRAFLPASMIDEHQPGDETTDPASLVGTEVTVVVTEVDRAQDRVVVSRRDHLRRQRRRTERDVFASLTVGKRVTGKVVGLVEYGAHVDLGGVRALLHRSEMSWGRVNRPADVVSVGDTIETVVIEVNKSKRRVGLSLRQLEADPFAGVEAGVVTTAVVTRVVEYGVFARLDDTDVVGLIHMSELTDLPGYRPDELVTPGENIHVKVLSVDPKKRRVSLSVRQALWS